MRASGCKYCSFNLPECCAAWPAWNKTLQPHSHPPYSPPPSLALLSIPFTFWFPFLFRSDVYTHLLSYCCDIYGVVFCFVFCFRTSKLNARRRRSVKTCIYRLYKSSRELWCLFFWIQCPWKEIIFRLIPAGCTNDTVCVLNHTLVGLVEIWTPEQSAGQAPTHS